MTTEHKFQLFIAVLSVVPATIVAVWALVNQLRQTQARLEVVVSPVNWKTMVGGSVLGEDLPGIVVRNQSFFPLRICNVGFHIEKKFHKFGKPLINRNSNIEKSEWPCEIAPRTRASFYVDDTTDDGQDLTKMLRPILKDKRVWEVGRCYVITECNKVFESKKLSRKTLKALRNETRPRG